MSDANATLGDNQGTLESSFFIANVSFYSNAGTTVTTASMSEFTILANGFVPSNQGTIIGTVYPATSATTTTTSVQSVEG